jgi:hypothetical protein
VWKATLALAAGESIKVLTNLRPQRLRM